MRSSYLYYFRYNLLLGFLSVPKFIFTVLLNIADNTEPSTTEDLLYYDRYPRDLFHIRQ